jgi:thiamine biosynthesis lipoprotein
MNKSMVITLCFFLLIAGLTLGYQLRQRPYEIESFGMGTIISQTIFGSHSATVGAQVIQQIKYLENMMTINAPGGDINCLNGQAGRRSVSLHSESYAVIRSALRFSRMSGGAFDITVGPLVRLWGIGTGKAKIPSDEAIKKVLPLIDYKDVCLDTRQYRASLKKSGQMIDLGGIAKGYAGDVAIKTYKRNGIHSACVNIGGNVVTLGNRPDGGPWRIGIQDPRADNGKIVGVVKVSGQAVVTSGDYQRYFIVNGKRYHHIFNPRTGYPANSGLISVTIIAHSSAEADALATAVFVLGYDNGMHLIKRYGVNAILITADMKIYVTPGIRGSFHLEDTGEKYQYVKKS